MANNKKLQVALTVLLILLFGGVVYLGYQAIQPPDYSGLGDDKVAEAREPREPIVSPRTDGVLDPESGDVIAGGVERPASDLESPERAGQVTDEAAQNEGFPYGKNPAVPIDANVQVVAVADAIKNRKQDPRAYAKAVSSHALADAFDQAKYESDEDYRESYVKNPQPSRVFQTAQPGPGVPQLRRMTVPYQKVVQGESTELKVRAVPGAPVTFTSFDLGRFDNELTSITVEADALGDARVNFQGTPGTIDDVNILAASPVTSGQVKLVVHVVLPE